MWPWLGIYLELYCHCLSLKKEIDLIWVIFNFRIESYSCKMIGTDKQMYKKFNADADGRSPHSLEALSPPQNGFGGYSFSPRQRTRTMSSSHSSDEDVSRDEPTVLCDVIPRKTLFYLLSTLNAAFVDYDFSDTKASEFSKEPSLQVRKSYM